MTREEFKQAMSQPKNVYCLVSTDSLFIDDAINRFKDAIKAEKVVYGSIQTTGLLFKKKTLCVLYEPKLTEELFERKEYIFIHTDSIEKRTSIFKKYKNQIVILDDKSEKDSIQNFIYKYITKNSDMDIEAAREFAKKCNNDLGIIKSELVYYNSAKLNYNDYSSDIYMWVENFIKNKPLPQVNESEISLMALLSNNCQDLLKVKQCKTAGMNPYRITCMSEMKECRTEEELKAIIMDCFFYDCQIKKGLIEPKYTIPIIKEKYYAATN